MAWSSLCEYWMDIQPSLRKEVAFPGGVRLPTRSVLISFLPPIR